MRFLPIASVTLSLLAACGAPPASAPAPATEAKAAPGFELKDLTGKTVKLSDSDGTVRLVDFWATWCAPCREEIPMFKDLHARYGGKGLTLIGIAMDDEGAAVVDPFVKENGMPYVNLLGNEDVAAAWGPLRGLPTKFLVDKQGRIVDTFFGPVPRSVLEKKIASLL
ncbi:MAG TPA: TlpA disulfide reductase family protein [Candidatus Bathyarchaeia archaeon]|nr:TlpA disulfide reductase family protein [Candidatus Bathyarchaeia archaeon]